jgi:hypothetical protein
MKALAFLASFLVIVVCGLVFLFSYRYRDINSASISNLSDFDKFLVASPLGWTIRSKEFDTICFTGNYVFALSQAKSFLPPNEANTRSALRFAGGVADLFNSGSDTSIVLLSHHGAQIFQLNRKLGFALKNVGCTTTDQAKIKIESIDSITELELPHASLGATHG